MSIIELTPEKDGLSVEVECSQIAEELGRQHILDDSINNEFVYLAAIALETMDDGRYDIEDTLMEFIRNTNALEGVSSDDCDKIERFLEE